MVNIQELYAHMESDMADYLNQITDEFAGGNKKNLEKNTGQESGEAVKSELTQQNDSQENE